MDRCPWPSETAEIAPAGNNVTVGRGNDPAFSRKVPDVVCIWLAPLLEGSRGRDVVGSFDNRRRVDDMPLLDSLSATTAPTSICPGRLVSNGEVRSSWIESHGMNISQTPNYQASASAATGFFWSLPRHMTDQTRHHADPLVSHTKADATTWGQALPPDLQNIRHAAARLRLRLRFNHCANRTGDRTTGHSRMH